MIKNLYWASCKVVVILSRFQRNLNLLNRLSKNTRLSNFMKIRPVGTELFHADDGRTDMTKLIVAILNFAQAPNENVQERVK